MYFIEQNHNVFFSQVKSIFPSFSIPSAGDDGGSQGYRDRYDIIEHGHEKSTFVCFFHRPIFTEIREFAAIILWMLAVFNCLGKLSIFRQ